jgi:hypothetical protein
MSLIALCYVCSIGIYYIDFFFFLCVSLQKTKTMQNSQREVTVKHTEM